MTLDNAKIYYVHYLMINSKHMMLYKIQSHLLWRKLTGVWFQDLRFGGHLELVLCGWVHHLSACKHVLFDSLRSQPSEKHGLEISLEGGRGGPAGPWTKGHGVCILVKNNFIHSQVHFQADLEAVAVCITINNKTYTVASVYVPPSGTLNELAFDRMIKSFSSRLVAVFLLQR